jgi:hypothetical protein
VVKTLLIALIAALLTSSGLAVSPKLNTISPAGAQRGTTLDLSFSGERLQDTEEIICYEPGVHIEKLASVTNGTVTAKVEISPDCPLGEHHLRLRAASGVSELRTFFVGALPVIPETEPNNDRSTAQKVPLDTTVAGIIKNEDVDYFVVQLKQGERFSAEVQGIRLGRANWDPRLTVYDESGSVVADADDTWLTLQDPFLSLVAPSNGTFIVELRDVTYGGGDNCPYLLHLGTFPRPESVFPLGGQTGQKLALAFRSEATGWFTNESLLPNEPTEAFGVYAELQNSSERSSRRDEAPSDAARPEQRKMEPPYVGCYGGGEISPTPNWIHVSSFPNVLAEPGSGTRAHATSTDLHPPLAFNGIISQKGQEDWFRFPATKDKALAVKVFARRLHSPLDSVIDIFDSAGKSIASDDDASGADSSLKFTPAENTNYFLRIRDTLGNAGPDFGYRVEIEPTAPTLDVRIPEVSRNDTQSRQYIAVPRGNRFATLMSAKRANFEGELVFSMEGLPAGVSMTAETLPAKVDSEPLVFEAAPDAPLAGKLLDLTAAGTNNQGEVSARFRQNVELVQGPPNNAPYYTTSVDKLYVAVTKEAPFTLRIVEPKVPLVQAGSMRLDVVAERARDFDEPIELKMLWNPPGVSSQSETSIQKGATNVFYQLNAGGGAETREWKIAVLGHAQVQGGEVYVSSQLTKLELARPFVTGKIETLWLNPGKSGKLTVDLEQHKPFDGTAKIRLEGLPDKVTADEKEISSTDKEVVFDVTVDAQCAPGSHKNLFCTVDVKQGDNVIPHTIAPGGILRIVPPKKGETKVVAASGSKK